MRQLFSQHPASVGETYFEHLAAAFGFGARMIAAGAACLVHGLLPFAFVRTGSIAVEDLHEKMISKRSRICAPHKVDQAHRERVHGAE